MIHREEESQLTAATVKLAKYVTPVTTLYNIARKKIFSNLLSPEGGRR